tara:strand:- start:344 stop:607 length:264 start_codon:yes stop_codon:yes gene_type:complete
MKDIIYDSHDYGQLYFDDDNAPQTMRVCVCEKTLSDGSQVYDVFIPAQTGTATSEAQATEFARRMYAAQSENTKPLDGLVFQSGGAA